MDKLEILSDTVTRLVMQGEKNRRGDSVEDPGQSISLLERHSELDDYDDDASLTGSDEAVAETALDSPVTAEPGESRGPRSVSSSSYTDTGSSSTRVKEPLQNALKLPLDQTDYLQPQSSVPATYLDLISSPGESPSLIR